MYSSGATLSDAAEIIIVFKVFKFKVPVNCF